MFGWKVEKWPGPSEYWLIRTGDERELGITGGVACRIDPRDTTVIMIDVPDVDRFAERVKMAGGTIRQEKQAIPGIGYLVTCRDTDGNTFGIMPRTEREVTDEVRSMSIYRQRISRATRLMGEQGLDALILVKPANMYYLVGDGRLCAYALITGQGEVGMGVPETDLDDVRTLAEFDHLVGFDNEVGMIHSIADYFKRFGIREGAVGVEKAFLPEPRMGMLTHPHAKPKAVIAKDCTPLMSQLRLVKDEGEIERLQAAARVAEAGMKRAIEQLSPGMTESQVAGEAEYAMRQAGAEDFYRTYVASGPRTSVAHGTPTQRKLRPNDLVVIDVHPVVNGYTADLCRTVCLGEPTDDQASAHSLYVDALERTIAKAVAGVTMGDLEETMHGAFEEAGHKDHIFGPPIHGVGIEFEESPLPAGHAFFHGEPAPPPLAAGVTIAIGNCGLYTGSWGVREEDTVVIGEEGPRALTRFPRQLRVAQAHAAGRDQIRQ